jgi:hypothetical protein
MIETLTTTKKYSDRLFRLIATYPPAITEYWNETSEPGSVTSVTEYRWDRKGVFASMVSTAVKSAQGADEVAHDYMIGHRHIEEVGYGHSVSTILITETNDVRDNPALHIETTTHNGTLRAESEITENSPDLMIMLRLSEISKIKEGSEAVEQHAVNVVRSLANMADVEPNDPIYGSSIRRLEFPIYPEA